MKILILITTLFCSLVLLGCGTAIAQYDLLPPAYSLQPLKPKAESDVTLLKENEKPKKTFIRTATIGVHGNGYADRVLLESKLVKQAAELGADFVIVTEMQITKDEVVGTYGYGMFMSSQIQRPHLYGVAGVWSKVAMGINYDDTGNITYVKANSPAEKAGIKEGYKLLAVEGEFFDTKAFTVEQIYTNKSPGDKLDIEYIDNNKVKQKATIILESPF
ncbi:MAG: PDZ domain-containing protein [Deferribacterales bacterium]